MLDFDKYLMRHGEWWIQKLVEETERYRGICLTEGLTLEERWDFIMNDMPLYQPQQLAA